MTVNIIIENYKSNNKIYLTYLDNEFKEIDQNWDKEDKLLLDMNRLNLLKDKLTWSKLDSIDFTFLITENLKKIIELPQGEIFNQKNPSTKSLNFLIKGLVRCLEEKSSIILETLKIQIINEQNVNYQFIGTICISIDKKPKLTIVK